MRVTILPLAIIYTDHGPLGLGQYDGSTASEVFLIFTT